METQSALKRVIWLLAGSVVVLIAILVIASTLLISCEPEKADNLTALDCTKEQLIVRGKYLLNTSDSNPQSRKILTLRGFVPDTCCLLSGHPSHDTMPQDSKDALKKRVFSRHALTSAVGHWGFSFAAKKTSEETGNSNWTEDQFLGQP